MPMGQPKGRLQSVRLARRLAGLAYLAIQVATGQVRLTHLAHSQYQHFQDAREVSTYGTVCRVIVPTKYWSP